MRFRARTWSRFVFLLSVAATFLFGPSAQADPLRYPQFAQQKLPEDITPAFISIDELVAEIKAGAKPLIIDVRTAEEFREVHILGAVSAPLGEFKEYLKSIPRDRPIVLY
ncbi:MAG TPA: rhodanese-like domain-containing protein [Candidatus Binatia bacterium]|nr:rhodanese-like domain-containing protein [Candidatus Binatia bacterium]